MTTHRHGRHRLRRCGQATRRIVTAAAAGAVTVGGLSLALGVPSTATPRLPPDAPASAVAPAPPGRHHVAVYDDDRQRGRERCDVWLRFYATGTADCAVRPTDQDPTQG